MDITLHLTVMLLTSVHTSLFTEWSLVMRSVGGGGSAGRESGPSVPPSPSCSPHRRKQGRYNLFSWLSMKVRGRGTRACVCLDLTPPSLPPTHPPPPPQLFISLGCLLTPVFLCLSPASFALLTHPGPLGGHTSSSFIRSVCSSYIISHTSRCCFFTRPFLLCLCCVSAGKWLLGALPSAPIIT